MGITFYQERKTERALEALRELASPRAKVLRDGEWQSVPGREVVRGDIVPRQGRRSRACGRALARWQQSHGGRIATYRRIGARAQAGGDGHADRARPGGDDLPFVYFGTLLTQGQGLARVVATGVHTEIGKIGKALQTLVPELSSIQRETRRAVVIFAVIGLGLCVLVTVLYGYRAATGSTACSLELRWQWRICRRNFRLCSRYSWRSVHGGSRNAAS